MTYHYPEMVHEYERAIKEKRKPTHLIAMEERERKERMERHLLKEKYK